jgi:hypothetical protein
MPAYLYQVVTPAGDGAVLEVTQSVHDAPLTVHPETGEPLRRIYTAPNLPLRHGDVATRAALSDASIARHGFTKYVREGRGRYVKTAGDAAAPGVISPG